MNHEPIYTTSAWAIVFAALCFAFTSNGFSQQNQEPVVTDKEFFYELVNVLLPRLADKGLCGEYIQKNPKLKNHQFPRPRPLAEFAASDATGKTSLPFTPISVELLEEAGVARNAAVRFGLPFPEKSLYSTNVLEGQIAFSVPNFCPLQSDPLILRHNATK